MLARRSQPALGSGGGTTGKRYWRSGSQRGSHRPTVPDAASSHYGHIHL
jgi:hypothetical protein